MTVRWGYQAFSEPKDWHVQAETDLAHPLASASVYIQIGKSASFPAEGQHILDVGGHFYLNITNQSSDSAGKHPIDYATVRAGSFDANLDEFASKIVALGLPRRQMTITWQHEPTVNTANQPKIGDHSGSAYAQTFNYVRDRMIAHGVNHRWGYFPVLANFSSSSALDYYPGDSAVDIIGADCYEHADSGKPFASKLTAFGDFVTAHRKIIAVGELGNDDAGNVRGSRVDWITNTAAWFRARNAAFINWNAIDSYGLVSGTPTYAAWLAAAANWY